jgi:hypothetical protein
VVGHVERGETRVGVGEHGVYGRIAVDRPPPSACLPHAVEHPAYRQGVPAVADRGHPRWRRRGGRLRSHRWAARATRGPQAARDGARRCRRRREGAHGGRRHGSHRARARALVAKR